jgi:hypothetical protein
MTEETPVEDVVKEIEDNPYDVSDPSIGDSDPGDESDSQDADPPAEAEPEPEPVKEAKKPAAKPDQAIAQDELESSGAPDGLPDPSSFLDDELAAKVFGFIRQQSRKIEQLEEMLGSAGIMAPREAAITKTGEMFPEVFGSKGSPLTAEQSESRTRLAEAAEIVRATYARRGKAAPAWDDLVRVAMSVEFPDLAQKAVAQQVKAVRRESQRIARPASREASLSREERAVRAARKMMLESAAFGSEVPDLD